MMQGSRLHTAIQHGKNWSLTLSKRNLHALKCSPQSVCLPLHVKRVLPLKTGTSAVSVVMIQAMSLHRSTIYRQNEPNFKASLFYIQNPFRWLSSRLQLAVLKSQWDSSFVIREFVYGAKQAICRIMTLVAHQQMNDLKGLIKQKGLDNFLNSINATAGEDKMSTLKLDVDDISIAAFRDVRLQSVVDKKYCDIVMIFVAIKHMGWSEEKPTFLMIEMLARFHREYTDTVLPEWTVTKLDITKYQPIFSS